MSKYTTEVRFICEEANGLKESAGYKDTPRVIANALASIFDFDFPIYDESYRTVLETKIINHYYTREIGYETVSLWKFALGTRMNEIMPYYNQLYKSALLEFNPFYDVDVTTEGNKNGKFDETTSASQKVDTTRTDNLNEDTTVKNTRTDNLQSQTTSNTSGSNSSTRTDDLRHADSETHSDQTTSSTTQIDLYSDTPQGALTDVEAERYLTTARKTTNNGTTNTSGQSESSGSNTGTVRNSGNESAEGTSNTSNTGTQNNDSTGSVKNTGTQDVNKTGNESGTRNYTNVDDYLEHVYGKRGGQSYASLLTEYRKTFLNIDMMIINDLADLFMNLW